MNCDNLAATGVDRGLPIALAVVLLLVGLLLFVLTRNRRRLGTVAFVTAVLVTALLSACLVGVGVVGFGGTGVSAARAATVGCVTDAGAGNSLTITQTSTIRGLAPNRAPAAITGIVTNNGTDDTFITEIVVSIVAVTKAFNGARGSCDASDYFLVAPRMRVGQPLVAGGSAAFTGAAVGFSDKATDQDACQGATVTLLYRAG